ncbi:MAG TPA: MlaD family protein [Gemmatimonadales bacterium]|nr:MlaD family protein [Gemmatimonadales bacterium]
METRQDFYVGLLLVVTIALVIGALIATSGWGERRYDLYVRVTSADGISRGTAVVIEGLDVGQVTSILPRVDSTTRRISFVAKLSVKERFEDGSRLQLPFGTRAELVQASQISAAVAIRLILPDTLHPHHTYLHAGDTLDSRRRGSALDAVAEVADQLSQRVQEMVRTATQTLVRVQSTLRDVTPDVERTLSGVAATMSRLDSVVNRFAQRGLADSVAVAVANTNRLLLRLDSVAREAHSLTAENRSDLRATVTNLTEASRQLNNFVDQMSRRPFRALTGVKPLPPVSRDSSRADSARPIGARP